MSTCLVSPSPNPNPNPSQVAAHAARPQMLAEYTARVRTYLEVTLTLALA